MPQDQGGQELFWEAWGVTCEGHDDDHVFLGYFFGVRDTVIAWLDAHHNGFGTGLSSGSTKLTEIKVFDVTPHMITNLDGASARLRDAQTEFDRANQAPQLFLKHE